MRRCSAYDMELAPFRVAAKMPEGRSKPNAEAQRTQSPRRKQRETEGVLGSEDPDRKPWRCPRTTLVLLCDLRVLCASAIGHPPIRNGQAALFQVAAKIPRASQNPTQRRRGRRVRGENNEASVPRSEDRNREPLTCHGSISFFSATSAPSAPLRWVLPKKEKHIPI